MLKLDPYYLEDDEDWDYTDLKFPSENFEEDLVQEVLNNSDFFDSPDTNRAKLSNIDLKN